MLRDHYEDVGSFGVLGIPEVGIIASQIISETATGDNGAGLLYNEALANAGKQLRVKVTSSPASGSLFVYENGSFELTGASDGAYSLGYQWYSDNVLGGSDVATFTVGAVSGIASGGTGTSTGTGSGGDAVGGTPGSAAAGGTGTSTGTGSGGDAVGGTPGSAAAGGGTGTSAGSGSGGSARSAYVPKYVQWTDWFSDIVPHVPGCPNPAISHALLRAAQTFYEDSRIWQSVLEPMAINAGDSYIYIDTGDSGQDSVRVEEAWYDGRPLDVLTVEDIDRRFADDWNTHTGQPTSITQIEPGVVRLYPIPVSLAVSGLKLRVSLKPSDTATGIKDGQALHYRDAIVTGAKSLLLDLPGYAWTNEQKGMMLKAAFEEKISLARYKAATAFGRGQMRASPKWC